MMLTASIQALPEGASLCSPAVGRFRAACKVGDLIAAGAPLGELEVLGRRHPVCAPALPGVECLRVEALLTARGWAPVGYGAPLLRALPWAAQGAAAGAAAASAAADAGLPADAVAIEAPIDGLFYASASPDAPPFAPEGALLQPGQVIGLIEVMKFFYEIRFENNSLGGMARVVRVVARDGVAVDAGSALLWVAPA
jgi:acetyl-CoA carboxylase biotin carboxyl carrier protein